MPRKVFAVNEILTAADVNSLLMDQAVMSFAGTAERGTAIASPSEGMVTYLEDSNELELYDGSSWLRVVPDATPTSPGVVKGTTSDGSNTALGDGPLEDNTTGDENTAVGAFSLRENTTGSRNVAVGTNSLRDNTEGLDNTAVGRRALLNNTTGLRNAAVGTNALQNNTTGNDNIAVGMTAMVSNTTGGLNTAVGRAALTNNTTGERNTASGYRALANNTTATRNTASGHEALEFNTTGERNTASGYRALANSTTGNNNTALGFGAGDLITTGSNNASLGAFADPSSATASNEVTLGDGNITSLRCNQTSISSLSDVRDKTDIETTALGLEVINKVRPVEFTWARRDGTMGNTPDLGFIAQELAEVEDDLGETDRLRLTLRDNPEKLEAAPGRLLPVLVKAVQELSAQNDELRARLDAVEGK